MLLQKLEKRGIIHPPSWLSDNCIYLTMMGSHAYGCNREGTSDYDYYGACIPSKKIIFPHLAGEIMGFGTPVERFEQWQEAHIQDESSGKEYDFQVFNIVKMFNLMMQNNPNCLDAIYTPEDCVQHITAVGVMIREHRDMFLHKGCFPKFKGYAMSQLHKMRSKEPTGKRKAIRDEYGFDLKFGMHLVRLLSECEMLLMEGTMDIRRNREQLKAIRRGEMSEENIMRWAEEKTLQLESLYAKSTLPERPREAQIKKLLMQCLEHHYGTLENCVIDPDWSQTALKEVDQVLDKYRQQLY
jgi:uncharacterized protein